jgi:anti-sigma factor RsiW
MIPMTQHIALDRMVELAKGRLSAQERTAAQAHLAMCTQCSTQYARMARVVAVTREDATEEVPTHVLARAQRLMRQRNAMQPAPPTLRERVVAALQWDSRLTPRAVGVRAGASTTRQIMFNAGAYDIDVRIKPSGARYAVAGQILGAVGAGSVELRGATTAQTTLNELGEWTFPPVAAGAYTLVLTLDERDITVDLDIGP